VLFFDTNEVVFVDRVIELYTRIWLIRIIEIDITDTYILLLIINRNLSAMKTLKIFAVLSFMLCFAPSKMYSQPAFKGEWSFQDNVLVACTNELAHGTVTITWVGNRAHITWKVEMTLIGASGTVYKILNRDCISEVDADFPNFPLGSTYTNNFTYMIHADGKLIGLGHGMAHIIRNADGEIIVDIKNGLTYGSIECL